MAEKKQENHEMHGKKEEITLSFNALAALFLGAMFLLAAFQALQLSELKQEVATQKNAVTQIQTGASLSAVQGSGTGGSAQAPGNGTASGSGSAQSGVPESLQNVPDMVGGC